MILRGVLSDTWIGHTEGPVPDGPSSVGGGAVLRSVFWMLLGLILAGQAAPLVVAATDIDATLGIGLLILPYAAMMAVVAIFSTRFVFGGLLALPMVLALFPALLVCGLLGRVVGLGSKRLGVVSTAVGLLPVWTLFYLAGSFGIVRWIGGATALAQTPTLIVSGFIAVLAVAAYRVYGVLWLRQFRSLPPDRQAEVLKDQGITEPEDG